VAQRQKDGRYKRAAHSFDPAAHSAAHGTYIDPCEDRCQQQFTEEVDTRNIVERFGMAGVPVFPGREGVYGDFTGLSDFADVEDRMDAIYRDFMRLPAAVREKFDNQASLWAEYAAGRSDDELIAELGLVKAPPAVPGVPSPGAAGASSPGAAAASSGAAAAKPAASAAPAASEVAGK